MNIKGNKQIKKCPCGKEFSYWRCKSDFCRDCRLNQRRENSQLHSKTKMEESE